MNKDVLIAYLDNALNYVSEAIPGENERWGTLTDHVTDINRIKTFIGERFTWMTNNIGSFSNCSTVSLPALVITKINYNPASSAGFSESNDSEFIAIKNSSDQVVNFLGIYLRQLGLTYQFPFNSSIEAEVTIYLACNSTVFQNKYGMAPFGQFARNLSN